MRMRPALQRFEPGDFKRAQCEACKQLYPLQMTGVYLSQGATSMNSALRLCLIPCGKAAEEHEAIRAVRIDNVEPPHTQEG